MTRQEKRRPVDKESVMTDADSERLLKLEARVGELSGKLASANQLISALADALRELHDFGVVDTYYRYEERSRKAFDDADKILKTLG